MAGAPGPRDDTELLGAGWGRDVDLTAREAAPPEPGRRLLARFAFRALLVLAVVAAADAVLRARLPAESLLPWMDSEFATYTVKVQRFAAAPAPDLLLLGNSRVHDGLVPEVFADALAARRGADARAYNLGLMNAKAAELSALVRSHLPDPPPRRVIVGLSGTELVNDADFQYASRFLWDAAECADYLARTPPSLARVEHVENWLHAGLGRLVHGFGQNEAISKRLLERAGDGLGLRLSRTTRRARLLVGRHNQADVLAPDGYPPELDERPRLSDLLAADPDGVRIPPYSLGDPSQLLAGADFPLMRRVVTGLQNRGCLVALVEVPPSPWLQERCPEFHGPLFRQRLQEFAASLGVPCVTLPPEESRLSNAAYVDANHLGRAGARRCSQLLAERLAAAGFLDGP